MPALDVVASVVRAIHTVVNPDKHGHLGPVRDPAAGPADAGERGPAG